MRYVDILAAKQIAAARKAKREEKRKSLPWAKKVKRKKLPSMARVKKECWEALSLFVRERDGRLNQGLCLICGVNKITLAYHLIPAGSGSMAKWDPGNIVGGCRDCNWGEKNRRVKYAYIHMRLFGVQYMKRLEERSRIMVQYKRHDFLEMTETFRRQISELRGENNAPKPEKL